MLLLKKKSNIPGNSDVLLESLVAPLLEQVVVHAAGTERQLAHALRVLGGHALLGDHSVRGITLLLHIYRQYRESYFTETPKIRISTL